MCIDTKWSGEIKSCGGKQRNIRKWQLLRIVRKMTLMLRYSFIKIMLVCMIFFLNPIKPEG